MKVIEKKQILFIIIILLLLLLVLIQLEHSNPMQYNAMLLIQIITKSQ